MHERTFAELYCEKHGLTADAYTTQIMRESLYLHARLVAPLIRLIWPRHFSADIDFVQRVGLLRRFRGYFVEADEFASHPENRGFWRTTVNLRVSSRRLRRLVRATLHANVPTITDANAVSAVPFGGKVEPAAPVRDSSKASA